MDSPGRAAGHPGSSAITMLRPPAGASPMEAEVYAVLATAAECRDERGLSTTTKLRLKVSRIPTVTPDSAGLQNYLVTGGIGTNAAPATLHWPFSLTNIRSTVISRTGTIFPLASN